MDYSMGQTGRGPWPTYSDKFPRNRPTDRSSPDRQRNRETKPNGEEVLAQPQQLCLGSRASLPWGPGG